MMIGIINTARPVIDRRKTIFGNPKRVEPKEAAATNRPGKDEFIPSSTQPDPDFLELYFSATGAKNRTKPR
ncbi:MAG: hypothetical protein O2844_04500 [Proteobacteria bacterium]|jgi:hypothetical protein|nr:hypothetical protein [Pseudomonadota bacterium]